MVQPVFRVGICQCHHCRRQCKIFASGVFYIFTHSLGVLSLKLLKLGKIDGVKFLAWKSGGVKFLTNSMSGLEMDQIFSSAVVIEGRLTMDNGCCSAAPALELECSYNSCCKMQDVHLFNSGGDFLRNGPFVTVWHWKIKFQMLWDRAKNDFTHSSTYPKDNKNIIGPPPRSLMNQHGLFEFSGMSHSDAG